MFTVLCRHAHSDIALKQFYMLQESLILCKNVHILLYLTLKENTISDIFAIYIYILQKGEHSCKWTELSLKRKEGIEC